MKETICPIMIERCKEKRLCCQPGYCNYCGYFIKQKEFKQTKFWAEEQDEMLMSCSGCKVNMKPWYQFILDTLWWIRCKLHLNKSIRF
jgi:predicted Zn-ribbon and HTH transcriptional regulator